jgi:hypothetical protein
MWEHYADVKAENDKFLDVGDEGRDRRNLPFIHWFSYGLTYTLNCAL